MKAKLVTTTNHGMSHYAGMPGTLEVSGYAQWFGDRNKAFHTSAIVSHSLEENRLTLYTLNSVYTFEIIEGEFDPLLLEAPPQWLIDKHKQRNETKHLTYLCQIMGGPMVDNSISIVTLPHPMDLQEARDYAAINTLRDTGGDIVTHILMAR